MNTEMINISNTMPVLTGSSNLDAYIQAARSVPILSAEEEYEGVDKSDCGMEAYPEFTRG